MALCGFCGQNARLTREDLIPRWMADLKPPAVDVVTQASHRQIRSWRTVSQKVELVARAFCKRCNNGWMSDLEVEAQPYLLPMVLGHEVSLSVAAQAPITAWCMKTAMAFEFAGHGGRRQYFTPEERRVFASLQTPPGGVAIFLAGYVGQQAFSAEEDH